MLKLKLLCLSLFVGTSLFAADRALLVGVGDYPAKENRLPGIDKDLDLFKGSLLAIGFKPETIRVLRDSEATYGAIRQGVQGWLTQGVGPTDRVVFFFSGHGSIVPDNQKSVGALIPYDIQVANRNILRALRGSELGELLSHNASTHILVVVDACHSGGLTDKGFNADVVPKFFSYPGMPTNDEPNLEVLFSKEVKATAKHVVLAACLRTEKAGATPNGSVLTLAVQQRVTELAQKCQRVTVRSIYIPELGKPGPLQHPKYSGDPSLYDYNWNTNNCRPTTRQADAQAQPAAPTPASIVSDDAAIVDQIYEASEHGLPVRISKDVFRAGESMAITVDVPADGYLNIVSVGDHEPASILFPNRSAPDNRVPAGRVTIPGALAFDIPSSLPKDVNSQNNAVLVLYSPDKHNFYDEGLGDGVFRLLGQRTRGFSAQPLANPFTSEIKYLKIVK
jgi:hypothetical protein